METLPSIVIIGAGVSGLFLSSLLVDKGFRVNLFDKNSQPGRKFLLAGKSGLNISNSIKTEEFSNKYRGKEAIFKELLKSFDSADLKKWLCSLGVELFEGSGGMLFPKGFSAKTILNIWFDKLQKSDNFNFYPDHIFSSIKTVKNNFESDKYNLIFTNEKGEEYPLIKTNRVVFALGGASYPATGSNGKWVKPLADIGLSIAPFLPANCGFETAWSEKMALSSNYTFYKNCSLSFYDKTVFGDLTLTDYGVEGRIVYALSSYIRDEIRQNAKAKCKLDLLPSFTSKQIKEKLKEARKKETLFNRLRKRLKLSKLGFSLLMELSTKEQREESEIANTLKNLEITLTNSRPIDEAISTAGGLEFSELTENLMIKKMAGCYCIGEMVDWEAPTGGFLMQGCFTMAGVVAKDLVAKLL